MGTALSLALACLALGAGELSLASGVNLQGRGRLLSQRDRPDNTSVEAVAIPRVTAEWILPDVRVSGSYAPRLRAPDLLDGADVVVLHAAELRASVRPHPAWQLSALAQGAMGTTDLLTEAHRTESELQTITTTAQLQYRAARGDLTLAGRPDPRTALGVTLGVFVDGGDGPRSEALATLRRGVRAEGGLTWTATRLDRLGLRLSALAARLDRGPTSAVTTAEAVWRHRFTRSVDGWVSAGATGAYEDPHGGAADRDVLPTAELGVAHTPPEPQATSGEEGAPVRETPAPRIVTQIVLRYAPVIDRAVGSIDPQLEGELRTRWRIMPRWSLAANVVGAIVQGSNGDSRRARLEAEVNWAARTWAHLGAGVYGSAQRSSTDALPSFDEYGVYVSVALDAPTLQP